MEEMVFTKEFRNVIYKRTLVEYESSIKERNNFGLCYAVRCVLLQMIDENLIQKDEDPEQDGISKKIDPYFSLDQYPELLDCKPAVTHDGIFWFPINTLWAIERRIEILNQIINETNPE